MAQMFVYFGEKRHHSVVLVQKCLAKCLKQLLIVNLLQDPTFLTTALPTVTKNSWQRGWAKSNPIVWGDWSHTSGRIKLLLQPGNFSTSQLSPVCVCGWIESVPSQQRSHFPSLPPLIPAEHKAMSPCRDQGCLMARKALITNHKYC